MRTVATLVVMFLLASPAMAAPMKVDIEQYQTAQSQAFSNPVFVFVVGNLPAQSQGIGLAWGLSKTWQKQWQGQSQKQQSTPVPTPSAAALLLAGLLGVAVMRNRRMLAARS